MTAVRRDFGPFARCDLPRESVLSCVRLQPGRLAVGPEEKQGLLGFRSGLVIKLSVHVLGWRSIRDEPASVLELCATEEGVGWLSISFNSSIVLLTLPCTH